MSRFFESRRAFDLAATLLVVLLAVSIADIDDYGMHSQAMRSPLKSSMSWNAMVEISSPTSESESGSEHVCACLLCVLTLPYSIGTRVLPPSAGKLSPPIVAGMSGSPHLLEVFHPPSA